MLGWVWWWWKAPSNVLARDSLAHCVAAQGAAAVARGKLVGVMLLPVKVSTCESVANAEVANIVGI